MKNLSILPIKERIKGLKKKGEWARFTGNNPINLPGPEIYLKWRSIENMDKETVRRERLKHLGCEENELIKLMAPEPGVFSFSGEYEAEAGQILVTELQRLTVEISAAYDLQKIYGPKDRENFGPILYCLIVYSQQILKKKIDDLQLKHREKFAAAAIIDRLTRQFNGKIKQDLAPCLVTEFHAGLQAGLLQGADSLAQFKYFACTLANSGEWVEYFFEEYPGLVYMLDVYIKNWLEFCLVLIKRLDHDLPLLYETFGIPGEELVCDVTMYKGDLHRKGLSTSLVGFSGGKKILYKPHSLEPDCAFQDFCRELFKMGLKPSSAEIKMIDRQDYGWQEFIEYRSCKKQEEVRDFFKNQGINLALFYLLGIADIDNDNIIAHGTLPCFIDMECLTTPRLPVSKNDLPGNTAAGKYFMESVARTGLIPRWSMRDAEDTGINTAGISSMDDQEQANIKVWRKDDKGYLLQQTEKVRLKSPDNHLPSLKGTRQTLQGYFSDFLGGFEEAYRFISNRKEAIEKELQRFENKKVRILMRHTNTYARILQESKHPDYMKDSACLDVLFDNFWGAYEQESMPGSIIQAEIDQLWNGDIPYFYSYSHSKNLWDGYDNLLCSDFFVESGLEAVKRRLRNLSAEDLSWQLSIIKRSLTVFESFSPDNKVAPLIPYSERAAADYPGPGRDELIEEAGKIGFQILDNSFQAENDLGWIDLSIGDHGQWEQQVKPMGLYDGTDGIALFFAYLHKYTGDARFKQAVEIIVKNSLKELEIKSDFSKFSTGRISFLSYPGSTLFLLDHLGHLYDSAWFSDIDLEKFYNWIEVQLEHDKVFDFLSGSAGAIHLLLNIFEKIHDQKALELASRCGTYLLENSTRLPGGLAWKGRDFKMMGGFAHGTSSYAWVLLRLGSLSGEEIFYNAGKKALDYDRSLFNKELRGWQDYRYSNPHASGYWCNGSGGIGLSRLLIAQYLDDDFLYEEMEIALDHLLKTGFSTGHCICHGQFGNLEIAYALAKKLNNRKIQSNLLGFLGHILQKKADDMNWSIGVLERNVDLLGMFLGLSGIGYNILRFADWQHIPSILAGERADFNRDNNPLH